MTSVGNGYVSSSLVREIASFGGDVSTMIPAAALARARSGRSRAAEPGLACHNRRGRVPTERAGRQEGHPDRHHLPRRAPRVADRERQEAAADDQRGARPERRAGTDRRAARRRARGGPGRQADQLRGRADHREGPGRGRADRGQGPGAGGVPDRRAWPDPGRRGAQPADHRRRARRRRRDPARRRRVRGRRPGRARGRRGQDAPEHQEGDRPARRAPRFARGDRDRRSPRTRASTSTGRTRRPRRPRPRDDRPASDEPFLWNVAGLLGEPPGAERDARDPRRGDRSRRGPPAGRTDRRSRSSVCEPIAASSPARRSMPRWPSNAAAACARSRCPSTSSSTRSTSRRSTWRPAVRCRPATSRTCRA